MTGFITVLAFFIVFVLIKSGTRNRVTMKKYSKPGDQSELSAGPRYEVADQIKQQLEVTKRISKENSERRKRLGFVDKDEVVIF